MLTVDELVDVVAFNHAVGERVSGHFDHDAMLSSGPPTNLPAGRAATAMPEEGGTLVRLRTYIHPATGEALLVPIVDPDK